MTRVVREDLEQDVVCRSLQHPRAVRKISVFACCRTEVEEANLTTESVLVGLLQVRSITHELAFQKISTNVPTPVTTVSWIVQVVFSDGIEIRVK